MTSTGRNETCPCGSGRKYKHCCEGKREHPAFSKTAMIFGITILIILTGGVAALLSDHDGEASARSLRDIRQQSSESSSAPATAAPSNLAGQAPRAPVPQPDGPAPTGKVWSPEHGHWHDSPVRIETQQGNRAVAATAGGQPQQGGLVWNEEHGHYHQAAQGTPTFGLENESPPGSVAQTAIPRSQIPRVTVGADGQARLSKSVPPPPGPTPEGKVWSSEHGHWHDANPGMSTVDPADQAPPGGTTPPRDPR